MSDDDPKRDASLPDAPLADHTTTAEHEAEILTFTVEDSDACARLDAYLAARVAHVSRTRLKQLIDDGEVLVSSRAAKPSHKLKAGETIELETPAPLTSNFLPEDIPLDIIYEDDSVIVVNKPAGLVVHPAAGVPTGTLANALAFRFGIADFGLQIEEQDVSAPSSGVHDAQTQDGEQPSAVGSQQFNNPHSAFHIPQSSVPQVPRVGIVHRLDRDTSGLVVIAKTAEAHESLMEQFRAREVFKSYVALVHGAMREDKGRIEEPIGRDARNRTRMAVVRGGRHALSLWRVRQRFTRFTRLDVEIKTGRTHQIRVHLAWLKHPVVGDKVYGAGRDNQIIADARVRTAVAKLDRQFLHAERLGFRHPQTGEYVKFRAPLPPELSALLDALEESSSVAPEER